GKALQQIHSRIETDHGGPVFTSLQRVVEKINRRFLLENQLVANTSAGIDQKRDAEREIGFGAEVRDGLQFVVLVNLEIRFFEVRNELSLAILVRYRKNGVYQDCIDLNCLLVRIGWFLRRLSRLLGLRRSLRSVSAGAKQGQKGDSEGSHSAPIITSR